MIKNENKKINKIEKLVEIIATNILKLTGKVDNIEKDVSGLKKDVGELKEGNRNIREDILNLGNRFPSQFSFDQLSNRVYNLEKKVISKK